MRCAASGARRISTRSIPMSPPTKPVAGGYERYLKA
jgi:hypothetical protein